MLLIITQTFDPTAAYVIKRLEQKGIEFRYLDTSSLLDTDYTYTARETTWEMSISVSEKTINVQDVKSVWYRKPKSPKANLRLQDPQIISAVERQAEELMKSIYVLLDKAKWVNNPNRIWFAGHKMHQLPLASSLGLMTPETLITNNPDKILSFITKHKSKVIMKTFLPVFLDMSDGEKYGAYTVRISDEILQNIESITLCPVIFQNEIEKEYELRITVIGDSIFAARIHSKKFTSTEVDWRVPELIETPWEACTIPDWLGGKCLEMTKRYNLSFAAFDFAFTPEGGYVFFEMNPNGQWAWIEEDTGLPMTEALIRTLGYA